MIPIPFRMSPDHDNPEKLGLHGTDYNDSGSQIIFEVQDQMFVGRVMHCNLNPPENEGTLTVKVEQADGDSPHLGQKMKIDYSSVVGLYKKSRGKEIKVE